MRKLMAGIGTAALAGGVAIAVALGASGDAIAGHAVDAPTTSATTAGTDDQLLAVAKKAATPAITVTHRAKAQAAGADPGFAHLGDRYYLYSTGNNFPVAWSAGPTGPWHQQKARALAKQPAWDAGKEWAPEVFASGSKFVIYYTASHTKTGTHCVGVAVSDKPNKGFKPRGGAICAPKYKSGYEAIDPAHFTAPDGTQYLVYKEDRGNYEGFRILGLKMNATGTAKAKGAKPFVLVSTGSGASARMEAPSLVEHNGSVYLFTSRGDYANCSYNTDVWKAGSITGNFSRVQGLLGKDSLPNCGPGGATVIQDGAVTRIAYHVWQGGTLHSGGTRHSFTGVVTWNDPKPATTKPAKQSKADKTKTKTKKAKPAKTKKPAKPVQSKNTKKTKAAKPAKKTTKKPAKKPAKKKAKKKAAPAPPAARAPGDLGLGLMPGTSPSIATLADGGYEIAFQANTGSLWTTGTAGTQDWGLGMMPGTSPSIAGLAGGGFQVAFQANTGNLWTAGSYGTGDWGLGMMGGTSPSITGLAAGGFQVAFQANTSSLWTVGSAGNRDWKLGMMPGTSPSITNYGGSFEVAFQANTGSLWAVGADTRGDLHYGMAGGTSPSITRLDGGWEIAFQANTSALWVVGADSRGSLGYGMAGGTSPSIERTGGNGWQVAFQANTGELYSVGALGSADRGYGLYGGTSPSVDSGGRIAFEANTTSLWKV